MSTCCHRTGGSTISWLRSKEIPYLRASLFPKIRIVSWSIGRWQGGIFNLVTGKPWGLVQMVIVCLFHRKEFISWKLQGDIIRDRTALILVALRNVILVWFLNFESGCTLSWVQLRMYPPRRVPTSSVHCHDLHGLFMHSPSQVNPPLSTVSKIYGPQRETPTRHEPHYRRATSFPCKQAHQKWQTTLEASAKNLIAKGSALQWKGMWYWASWVVETFAHYLYHFLKRLCVVYGFTNPDQWLFENLKLS